jgi:hypothetical protein
LHSGWGWTGAAQLHLQRARELFETGTLVFDGAVDGKAELTEQELYADLIADWADKTGRPFRRGKV